MFIENPHKKETYSFRVKPDSLRDIKLYAKATNQTVPEILNQMIEDKVDGLHLTNDYLENKLSFNGVIGLPPLTEIYDNGNYKEFGLFFESKNRVFYELQRVPNNLDIWDDNKGYTSNKRGVDHEGISFIIATELVDKPEYLKQPELLFCCFVPVYFKISINSIRKSTIQAKNINFSEALDKIKNSPNLELLDEFTQYTEELKRIIYRYYSIAQQGYSTPDEEIQTFNRFKNELETLSKSVNTNIVSREVKAIERLQNKRNKALLTQDGVITTDTVITDLLEENQDLQNKVNELETKLNKITDFLELSQDPEYRQQVWENLKTEK